MTLTMFLWLTEQPRRLLTPQSSRSRPLLAYKRVSSSPHNLVRVLCTAFVHLWSFPLVAFFAWSWAILFFSLLLKKQYSITALWFSLHFLHFGFSTAAKIHLDNFDWWESFKSSKLQKNMGGTASSQSTGPDGQIKN